MLIVVLILMPLVATTLFYLGRPYLAWVLPSLLGLSYWAFPGSPGFPFYLVSGGFVVAAILFGVPPIRRVMITSFLMRKMAAILPRISETEKLALEAGTVWFDGELFSGNPDWKKLARFEPQPLSKEEIAFLEGPVEELCRMHDNFMAWKEGDLAPEVWEFLKEHRFFGMIIPKKYGGLGFSAAAHSAVVTKVCSCGTAVGVTVMVPNSLGPAELILNYGTAEQKDHYLPRLATGEEIPSFALTEPQAGSDAASGQSQGVVCRGTFEGKEIVGIRLSWNKRYATLAPVATVLGLAFDLRDPERLLGDNVDPGITCALIPTDFPGVEIGRRHDPLGVPFLNGPTTGKDLFVPVDFIIGGPAMAGQGWRMLMESLASGRSISLPALSTGASQLCVRYTGAYATVREQFNLPIGKFEGVLERLGRMGGLTYLMEASRRLTAGAVDAGEKPSVISAIAKASMTELMRTVVNDAMDISAGAGISRGPRNVVAGAYGAIPIGITVEGANILTRCLIIFGQGAIRCHPWVQEEIHSVEAQDLKRFDHAFFKHIGFTLTNATRAVILGVTGGRATRPGVGGALEHQLAQLTRMSAAFTFLSDLAMATLGANLKRKEMLSGRMADALSWMYLGSATVKRYLDDGQSKEDLAFARWGLEYSLHQIQTALLGFLDNFPSAWTWFLKLKLFPYGANLKLPSDDLTAEVGGKLLFGNAGRERLTGGIFIPPLDRPGLGRLEAALQKVVAAYPVREKLREALGAGRIKKGPRRDMAAEALENEIISREEHDVLMLAIAAREDAVQVDAFPGDFLGRGGQVDETFQAQA